MLTSAGSLLQTRWCCSTRRDIPSNDNEIVTPYSWESPVRKRAKRSVNATNMTNSTIYNVRIFFSFCWNSELVMKYRSILYGKRNPGSKAFGSLFLIQYTVVSSSPSAIPNPTCSIAFLTIGSSCFSRYTYSQSILGGWRRNLSCRSISFNWYSRGFLDRIAELGKILTLFFGHN